MSSRVFLLCDPSQVQARLSTVKEARDTYQKHIEELGISVEEEKNLRLELVRATTMILPKHFVFWCCLTKLTDWLGRSQGGSSGASVTEG